MLLNGSISDISDHVYLPGNTTINPQQRAALRILPLLVVQQSDKLRLCWDGRLINSEISACNLSC